MKRIVLIMVTVLLLGNVCCRAQYNYYYSPHDYAVAAAEANETYRLRNIRFDENALKKNPEAWQAYQNYLQANEYYADRRETYRTVTWIGVGVVCLAAIPVAVSHDPVAVGLSACLMSAGGVAALVGSSGMAIQLNAMKSSKKEFIYYLKTTNNGVGIVTLF